MSQHVRAALVGCALGFLAAVAPACQCGPSTTCASSCAGCCDSNGNCKSGNTAAACGKNGFLCTACGNSTVCSASGTCASATCTGCFDSASQCRSGTESTACGADAGTCATCGGNQVCVSGSCQVIGGCTAVDAGCGVDTECCSLYCDHTLHCAVRPGADAGADGGTDAGSGDAGTDGGSDGGGACNTLSFASPSTYATGNGPLTVVSGDLNQDNWPDLVVVAFSSNAVNVFINQRDGGFDPGTTFPVGNKPEFVALVDLNRDGLVDIAVSNSGDGTLTFLRNQGDGGFAASTLPAAGALGLAAGDWNGDGWPDLLVTTGAQGSANLFLNDGGTLTLASSTDAGNVPRSCALADVNGDGLLEGLVLGSSDGLLHILGNAGDGGFGGQRTFAGANQPLSLAVGPISSAGSVDIAVVDRGTGVNVLINDAGNFSTQMSLPLPAASAVRIADINGDGRADLIVGRANPGFTVFLRDGGSFSPVSITAVQSDDVAVADFNRDGRLDVATVNFLSGGLSVYLNTCSP